MRLLPLPTIWYFLCRSAHFLHQTVCDHNVNGYTSMCPKWSLFFRSWIVYCTVSTTRKVLWNQYNLSILCWWLQWADPAILVCWQDCDEAVPPASPGADAALVEQAPVGTFDPRCLVGLPGMCGRQVGVNGRTFHSTWIEITILFVCRPHELDFSEQVQHEIPLRTFWLSSTCTTITHANSIAIDSWSI